MNNGNRKFVRLAAAGALLTIASAAGASNVSPQLDAKQLEHMAESGLASRPWYAPAGMPQEKPTVVAKVNGATRTDAGVIDGEQPPSMSIDEQARMYGSYFIYGD